MIWSISLHTMHVNSVQLTMMAFITVPGAINIKSKYDIDIFAFQIPIQKSICFIAMYKNFHYIEA